MKNEIRDQSPKLRHVCFSVLILCVAFLPVFALQARAEASYERGLAARAAGDYEEALIQWMASIDDPRSMTAIGSMYDYGEGLPQNHERAVEWYTKAAELGEYRAIAQLAKFSLTGTGGVEQNPTVWRNRLEQIEGRDAYADYILAFFYLGGYGGERDVVRGHAILYALVNERGHLQLESELRRAEALLAAQGVGEIEALSIEALIGERLRDRAAFDENHKDRRIVVNGWFHSSQRIGDYGYVARFGGAQHSELPQDSILAVFYEPSSTGVLSALEPGMLVVFSGVYVGDQPFPLGDCAFVLFGSLLLGVVEAQYP